uniref:Peptidase M15A C-terminal domain-containing protein n=1 Tax=candidate division WOR-3 bacterium TaxID=2052148 RepID=A0A7C6AAW8_UNCW3
MVFGCLLFWAIFTAQGIAPISVPSNNPEPFKIEIGSEVYDWDVVARFVMPNESVLIRVVAGSNLRTALSNFGWVVSGGTLLNISELEKVWIAPQEPGLYQVIIANRSIKTINIFVMVPYDSLKNGRLNGYLIGSYPRSPSPHPRLTTPKGFVEVTPENENTPVSPNFTLKEFVCRQPSDYPKYLVLKEELVMKLELLLAKIRDKGYQCSKLVVFSGYRPPRFNAGGGGGRHSAHIYGGAADIFIDENNDGMIDDLNGDGRCDSRDSKILFDLANELDMERPDLVGGLGWYRKVGRIGPCIHIDVRGKPTRWRQ